MGTSLIPAKGQLNFLHSIPLVKSVFFQKDSGLSEITNVFWLFSIWRCWAVDRRVLRLVFVGCSSRRNKIFSKICHRLGENVCFLESKKELKHMCYHLCSKYDM
jgi:hypothetical protein